MTFLCNGCGGEFEDHLLGSTLSYGSVLLEDVGVGGRVGEAVRADYHKELCPRCQHVMKDILLSSDLSEQWGEYDWTLEAEEVFVEPYDV